MLILVVDTVSRIMQKSVRGRTMILFIIICKKIALQVKR
jgi:hypothetical protein